MHYDVSGNLAALLWAALAVVLFTVVTGVGLAAKLVDGLVKYLTTPRVGFNANLTTSTQDEMDAMLARMAHKTKGPNDTHV